MRFGKSIEEALVPRLFALAYYDLFIDAIRSYRPPVGTEHLGVDDEILPKFGVRLVIIGERREPDQLSLDSRTDGFPNTGRDLLGRSYTIHKVHAILYESVAGLTTKGA